MSDVIDTSKLAEIAIQGIEEISGKLLNAKRTDTLKCIKNALDGVITTIHQQGYDEGYRIAKGEYDLKITQIKKSIEGLE